MYLTIKPTNIYDVSYYNLSSFLKGKEYKDFIQFFLTENTKGENGLLVQYLRDSLDWKEEKFLQTQIEYYNVKENSLELWSKSSSQFLEEFFEEYKVDAYKNGNSEKIALMFILLTLNYVFIAYTNKPFRKELGLKKYFSLKPFKV